MNRPSWYVDQNQIRQVQNHRWTPQEIKQIYALRIAGYSIKTIIEKMRLPVGAVPLYNVIRMMRKRLQGKCLQCGEKLTEEELLQESSFPRCGKCLKKNLEMKREIRLKYQRKGLCAVCGKRAPIIGKMACKQCLSFSHRNRYVRGLCGKCGERPISPNSIALCTHCLKENREYTSAYREKMYANS